jgi:hypothetical protein
MPDNHRFSYEFRPAAELDRNKKGVHIDVHNAAAPEFPKSCSGRLRVLVRHHSSILVPGTD